MATALSKEEWRRRRRMKHYVRLGVLAVCALMLLMLLIWGVVSLIKNAVFTEASGTWSNVGDVTVKESLLPENEYSRPGYALENVEGVVIHYTGSAGTTAMDNRNYFYRLQITETTYESMHFEVGLDGEIVQCIPLNEIAYASGKRNADTIAVEYCHSDVDGRPNDATYASLVKLVAKICKTYKLGTEDILRHYDVTGVECPKYYVENEDEWNQFKEDVKQAMNSIY